MKISNIQILITAILKQISNPVLHILDRETFVIWMRHTPSALLTLAKPMLHFYFFFSTFSHPKPLKYSHTTNMNLILRFHVHTKLGLRFFSSV